MRSRRRAARIRSRAGLDVRDVTVHGPHGAIPMRRYAPAGPEGAEPLLWVHGGGFAFGGLDLPESDVVAADLARAGRVVHTVQYRTVRMWNIVRDPRPGTLPGVRYPVPLDDVVAAFRYVRDGSPLKRALIGGASAGANLAAACALRLRDAGETGPSGLLLAYADMHATLPPLSAELAATTSRRGSPRQMSPRMIARMNWNYAGSIDARAEPYAFPGGHDLRGLPPVLAIDADRDHLRASGGAFAEELVAAGVQVAYSIVAGSGHGFLNEPGTAAYLQGVRRMSDWLHAAPGRP